ncbi:MAG: hypothetical protein FWC56_01990 [Phycisphaerae bacterium]|nr:hypothetical protein [Phycisphaerae bacterium]
MSIFPLDVTDSSYPPVTLSATLAKPYYRYDQKTRLHADENAEVVLDISVAREVCNKNLAHTSTTAILVMGNELIVALSTARNFQR